MSHWKLDLVNHFLKRKHPKYVMLEYQLIARVNKWAPAIVRNDLIYHRTVNKEGGIGRNLSPYSLKERLNRLFRVFEM